MFSGGIEKQHQAVMGWWKQIFYIKILYTFFEYLMLVQFLIKWWVETIQTLISVLSPCLF